MSSINMRYFITFFPRLPDTHQASARHTQAIANNELWPAAEGKPAMPALRPLHTHRMPKRPSGWAQSRCVFRPLVPAPTTSGSACAPRSASFYDDLHSVPPMSPAMARLRIVLTRDSMSSLSGSEADSAPVSSPAASPTRRFTSPSKSLFQEPRSEDEFEE